MYSSSTAIAKQVQHPLAIPTLCSSRRGMLLLASSISLAGEAAEGQAEAGAALQEEQQAAGTTQLQLQQAMTAAVPMLHTYSRRQQQQQLAQQMWCRPEQAEVQQRAMAGPGALAGFTALPGVVLLLLLEVLRAAEVEAAGMQHTTMAMASP